MNDFKKWIVKYENSMEIADELGMRWVDVQNKLEKVLLKHGFCILSEEEVRNYCGGDKFD